MKDPVSEDISVLRNVLLSLLLFIAFALLFTTFPTARK